MSTTAAAPPRRSCSAATRAASGTSRGRSPTTDFKLRFYGSVLGYAWTLVRPFAFFGVIWFVFAEIVDAGDGVKNYPAYILMALVLFQFFLGIVTASLDVPGRPPEPAAQDAASRGS